MPCCCREPTTFSPKKCIQQVTKHVNETKTLWSVCNVLRNWAVRPSLSCLITRENLYRHASKNFYSPSDLPTCFYKPQKIRYHLAQIQLHVPQYHTLFDKWQSQHQLDRHCTVNITVVCSGINTKTTEGKKMPQKNDIWTICQCTTNVHSWKITMYCIQ